MEDLIWGKTWVRIVGGDLDGREGLYAGLRVDGKGHDVYRDNDHIFKPSVTKVAHVEPATYVESNPANLEQNGCVRAAW
jgi:hypothetical protein